jgi:hypothetical protein
VSPIHRQSRERHDSSAWQKEEPVEGLTTQAHNSQKEIADQILSQNGTKI